ncbi:MAG TPA: DNA recombination protein RmuC [bacterium]|nr:DNA recombination protein RmuC [bacterium]
MLGTIVVVVCAVIVLVLFLLMYNRIGAGSDGKQSLSLMQDQVNALRRETTDALTNSTKNVNQQLSVLTFQVQQRLDALDRSMRDTTGQVNTRLDNAVRVIREVSATMGELSKSSQQIYEVGKDIASLQEILRAPKLRGVVGELFLGNLLDQVVPQNYELQHRFRSGEAVDAVIKLGPKLVPIDAKFPLENFQRLTAAGDAERKPLRKRFIADVEKHVDAIASKYILPDEGTYDFALMYIPAENVYYETIIKDEPDEENVSAYAVSRRVIPVSPNSLYAYLQAIVFGLRGLQIEKRAEEILGHLNRLQGDFGKFREDFDTVGTHLKNAHNKYDDALKRLGQLEGKLEISSALAEPPGPESLSK